MRWFHPLRYPLLALTLLMVGSASARAEFAYAIGDGGSSLVSFNTSSPGAATRVGYFQTGLFLDAIDFRPSTGQLYGYSSLADRFYTVNLQTGALTAVGSSPTGAPTNTFNLGMDFNPTNGLLRVVTDSAQNIVYNPVTGTSSYATSLAYATGDVAAGKTPLVIDNAYTNNVAGATTTQQYGLDYDQNTLVTIANNAGTLSTIGKIRLNGVELDFNEISGFDISTDSRGINTAFALLKVNNISGLYTIDLSTGNATSLGGLDSRFTAGGTNVYSLAILNSAVPEPGSLLMVSLGVAGLITVARRRSA